MRDMSDDKRGEALNAERFRMLEDIARDLAGDVVFPTYFDAALRLRKELQHSDLPLERIARIVGVEPLIASKLMHMANSAMYGGADNPVRSLAAAIARLGVDLVRTTALAIAMGQLMRSRDMVLFADLTHALWVHTIKTAAAARVLARSGTRINPDEALLAGLVHDLGAFYMLYRAAQYPELRARPETMKFLIVQWHESIGVSLLNALGIPEDIVAATIDHDQPRPSPTSVRTLSEIVYVANILAGAHFEWLYQDFNPDAGEAGIVRRNFEPLLAEIEADANEMQSVFA
jgi:HD-like signal output (HDOD) protein